MQQQQKHEHGNGGWRDALLGAGKNPKIKITGSVEDLQREASYMLRAVERHVEAYDLAVKNGEIVMILEFKPQRGRGPGEVRWEAREGGVRFFIDRGEERKFPTEENRNWACLVTNVPEAKEGRGTVAYVRPLFSIERVNKAFNAWFERFGEEGSVKHPEDAGWVPAARAKFAEIRAKREREKREAERAAMQAAAQQSASAPAPVSTAMADALTRAGLAPSVEAAPEDDAVTADPAD